MIVIGHYFVMLSYCLEVINGINILVIFTVIIRNVLVGDDGSLRFNGNECTENAQEKQEEDNVYHDIVSKNDQWFHE
jgi:hypothetical protein